jgi:stage V sporulation protein S
VTKIGQNTNPREIASQIAAQARAAVDCPVLQCVGPQSINQAIKAVAIARTYLHQSDAQGNSSHPDLTVYPEFIKLDSNQAGARDDSLSAMQMSLSKRARRTSVDKEGRSLKVGNNTEAKSLAGAIASCTREGSRVELTAIGAGSVNQAIKSVAIARQYVEEEAIDLCCRPEFVEIADGQLGDGSNATSAVRLIVLVEQC